MTRFLIVYLIWNFFFQDLLAQNKTPNFLVIVGEKISIDRLPKEFEYKFIADFAFIAKYKVNQVVFGIYKPDTIQFEVHDHYGFPNFGKYNNVLLYLSKYDNKWYHEKYMYSNVYPTMNGRWAGPYEASDYSRLEGKNLNIKPETILFKDTVWVDISGLKNYKRRIAKRLLKSWYPEPYYGIKSDSAYVKMGNYVEELLEIQRHGVLEARGIKW
jgi:hypothetical protein